MPRNPKTKIPSTVRNKVWNNYVGIKVGEAKCFCCDSEPITRSNFECGHIISEKEGGKITIQNLRPICKQCNCSMNTKNMVEFMKKYGFVKRPDFDGLKINEYDIVDEKREEKLFDLNILTVKELKYICNYYDLSKSGNKKDLIKHIVENDFDYDQYVKEQLKLLKIPTLKNLCRDFKISSRGNKAEIVNKLSTIDQVIEFYVYEETEESDSLPLLYLPSFGSQRINLWGNSTL